MTYNGWENHATWCVSLWINNDKGLYDNCMSEVRLCKKLNRSRAGAVEELSKFLEEWLWGDRDLITNPILKDLLNLSEVRFEEVAEGFVPYNYEKLSAEDL